MRTTFCKILQITRFFACRYTFEKLQFTGIIRDPSEIIGNPVFIESNYENLSSCSTNEAKKFHDANVHDSAHRPILNNIEDKQKSREQQLTSYFNRDAAKLKLRKTILLQQKNHHEQQLTVWISEKAEIEKKVGALQEKINNFNGKLETLSKKTAECQQKINYYSEFI